MARLRHVDPRLPITVGARNCVYDYNHSANWQMNHNIPEQAKAFLSTVAIAKTDAVYCPMPVNASKAIWLHDDFPTGRAMKKLEFDARPQLLSPSYS